MSFVQKYLEAKRSVIDLGYADEIDWQNNVKFDDLTCDLFLREYCWVVLNSGMREGVCRKLFPQFLLIFDRFESLDFICGSAAEIRDQCLSVFRHEKKINAIIETCKTVQLTGFGVVKQRIALHGVKYLMGFGFIGPATSYHLAKNIGFECVKPDRHLVRIAQCLGFSSPDILCERIKQDTGDKLSVVDIVLWRFATQRKDYELFFGGKS
jgi:hypothetical protein